jgi:hypothetical protein
VPRLRGRGKQRIIVIRTYLLSELYVTTYAFSRPKARYNDESALSLALLTTASSRGRGKARSPRLASAGGCPAAAGRRLLQLFFRPICVNLRSSAVALSFLRVHSRSPFVSIRGSSLREIFLN